MNGLRYIRNKCNLSLSELADKLGVTRQMVSAWENGRKSIPESRLHELSKIFGIEEELLGEISEAQLADIDNRPVFMSKGSGKEEYRFDEVGDAEQTIFPLPGERTLDEEYQEVKKYRKRLMDSIQDRLSFDDSYYLYDEISMIRKMAFFYESVNKLVDAYGDQERYLKVGFRYEIMAVMDAMLLAYGISDESRLDELKSAEGMVKEDPDYVKDIAELIKRHWKSQSEYLENCRHRK